MSAEMLRNENRVSRLLRVALIVVVVMSLGGGMTSMLTVAQFCDR